MAIALPARRLWELTRSGVSPFLSRPKSTTACFMAVLIADAIGCKPLLPGCLKYIPKGKLANHWEFAGKWSSVCLTRLIVASTGQVGSFGILSCVMDAARPPFFWLSIVRVQLVACFSSCLFESESGRILSFSQKHTSETQKAIVLLFLLGDL